MRMGGNLGGRTHTPTLPASKRYLTHVRSGSGSLIHITEILSYQLFYDWPPSKATTRCKRCLASMATAFSSSLPTMPSMACGSATSTRLPFPSARTTTLHGRSRPMSGSCSNARCASGGIASPEDDIGFHLRTQFFAQRPAYIYLGQHTKSLSFECFLHTRDRFFIGYL